MRPFPVVSGRARGRGGTQHIASLSAENTSTSCVSGPLRGGGAESDPELVFFGSAEKITGIYDFSLMLETSCHFSWCDICLLIASIFCDIVVII